MKDVATYIDPELQYGKMYIKWVKDQVKPMNRPEWRYWGAKPIPQLTAPPTFEPFKDTVAWSRSDRLKTTGKLISFVIELSLFVFKLNNVSKMFIVSTFYILIN